MLVVVVAVKIQPSDFHRPGSVFVYGRQAEHMPNSVLCRHGYRGGGGGGSHPPLGPQSAFFPEQVP